MDTITVGTSEGLNEELQSHLSKMDANPAAKDSIPIPLNEDALARQTRLQSLKDELAVLQARLGDIRTKASRAGHQAADVVKTGAKWADDNAHRQLGSYPWAKLAGATAATVVRTRLLRMLPLGGILSIAAPLIISQVKARNERDSRR